VYKRGGHTPCSCHETINEITKYEYRWWSICFHLPRWCQKMADDNSCYWTSSKSCYEQLRGINVLENVEVFGNYSKLQLLHSKTHHNMKLCCSWMPWGSTKLENDGDYFCVIRYYSIIWVWDPRYFHIPRNLCWRRQGRGVTARRKGLIGIDLIKHVSWMEWRGRYMKGWHEKHSRCMGIENCSWLGENIMMDKTIKHDLVW